MNKLIYCVILSLLMSSCAPTLRPSVVTPDGVAPDCSKAGIVFWGAKGENPSNNDVWRCYDWELYKQK